MLSAPVRAIFAGLCCLCAFLSAILPVPVVGSNDDDDAPLISAANGSLAGGLVTAILALIISALLLACAMHDVIDTNPYCCQALFRAIGGIKCQKLLSLWNVFFFVVCYVLTRNGASGMGAGGIAELAGFWMAVLLSVAIYRTPKPTQSVRSPLLHQPLRGPVTDGSSPTAGNSINDTRPASNSPYVPPVATGSAASEAEERARHEAGGEKKNDIVNVTCPEGIYGDGNQTICVQHPFSGAYYNVPVPTGIGPGQQFTAEFPALPTPKPVSPNGGGASAITNPTNPLLSTGPEAVGAVQAGRVASAASDIVYGLAGGVVHLAEGFPVLGRVFTVLRKLKGIYDSQKKAIRNCAELSSWVATVSGVIEQLPAQQFDLATDQVLQELRQALESMCNSAVQYTERNALEQYFTSGQVKRQTEEAMVKVDRLIQVLDLGTTGTTLRATLDNAKVTLDTNKKMDKVLLKLEQRSAKDSRQNVRERDFSMLEIDSHELSVHRHLQELGRGGSGTVVYSAEYAGAACAAKVTSYKGKTLKEANKFVEEIKREVSTMSRVGRHPRVLNVLGVADNVHTQEIIVLMDLAAGGSLREFLDRQERTPLPIQQVKELLLHIVSGLQFLHRKRVWHRDLKTLNLLLDDPAGHGVRIADFGLSISAASSATTGYKTSTTGSTPWMSPEHLNGEEYTAASDVYSLGVVIWEVLTRRAPWQDYSIQQIIGKVAFTNNREGMPVKGAVPKETPKELVQVMQKCWSQKACNRPSLDDVKSVIDRI